jgi:hypothetical protein
MENIHTLVIVKNIPLQKVEQLIKQVITPDFFEDDFQEIVFNLKNSRLLFLSFPNEISNKSFNLLVDSLLGYNENQISKSEIIAIYKNQLYIKQPNNIEATTVSDLLSLYKLDKGPLHQITILNKNNSYPKKWWQFWK